MKALSFSVMVGISLCASLCCPEEDDYLDQTLFVQNDTIISVENNQTTYDVGDTIVIETVIENDQLTIDNLNITLSDFTYAEIGESRAFHQLALYKETAFESVVQIPLNESSIEVNSGDVRLNNQLIEVISLYDGNTFRSKFSIRLLESGTFYLAGPRLLFNNSGGETTINVGVYEKGFVDITSKIINSDEDGKFVFTVN
ncbi:hypothetical protein [Winogradskyella jejuensis]|uniref:DUF4382 domain-containing protein n=1 Tax=Winogradskyella jejuensis TaxID=1089305 RepID=A0A1M5UG40_9FLAO|nr:hypothetical protein [Winogradskyella jejuensis]SHH61796.1 hypothetical protein SAMN05444148_2468 [Winogradskyella jejuensis]